MDRVKGDIAISDFENHRIQVLSTFINNTFGLFHFKLILYRGGGGGSNVHFVHLKYKFGKCTNNYYK